MTAFEEEGHLLPITDSIIMDLHFNIKIVCNQGYDDVRTLFSC